MDRIKDLLFRRRRGLELYANPEYGGRVSPGEQDEYNAAQDLTPASLEELVREIDRHQNNPVQRGILMQEYERLRELAKKYQYFDPIPDPRLLPDVWNPIYTPNSEDKAQRLPNVREPHMWPPSKIQM